MNPADITNAISTAQRLLAELPTDDPAVRLGIIEGETDAFEIMDRLAELALADTQLVERARERATRLEERAKRARTIIMEMLLALGLTEPLQRPLYTASLAYHATGQITDPALLPPEMLRTGPDLIRIAKELRNGKKVPGAVLSNPAPRLTLRSN